MMKDPDPVSALSEGFLPFVFYLTRRVETIVFSFQSAGE